MTRKYGKGSQKEVEHEMHKYKQGKAYSGKGKNKVKSHKKTYYAKKKAPAEITEGGIGK